MRGKLIDIHASRCPFVFGRAHETDLCIMDRELSRRHGAIIYVPNRNGKSSRGKVGGGNFVLVDLGSTVRDSIRVIFSPVPSGLFISHCAQNYF